MCVAFEGRARDRACAEHENMTVCVTGRKKTELYMVIGLNVYDLFPLQILLVLTIAIYMLWVFGQQFISLENRPSPKRKRKNGIV